MNRKRFWFFSLVMAVLSLTAGSLWESALACNVPPPPASPPPPATVRHKSRTKVKIRIKNYTTFGVGAGQGCACGLKRAGLGTIVSVDRARIVRAGTNTLVPGFPFTPNATTTASFNSLEAGTWQGFFTQTDATVPEGIPTEIVFDATVVDGSTDDDVARDLAGGTIGTGPANMDGTVDTTDPTHLGLVGPGDITNENLAYVANNTSGNFTFYLNDATNGPLSQGPGSPFAGQGNPDALTFIPGIDDSVFDWLVVPNSPFSTVSLFREDRDTGGLTPNGPPVPSGGMDCTDSSFFPSDSFFDVFVEFSHQGSNNIVTHRFNRSTGALTQIQSVPTGPSPQKLATFILGAQRFVVSANCGGAACDGPGSVSVFSANATTGQLTEVNGSPFLTQGVGTVWAAADPTNQWLAAANARSSTITVFSIDQIAGSLTLAGPPVPSGGLGNSSVTFDPSGGFLIATNLLSGNGMVFAFDPTTGSLMPTSTFQTGTGPSSARFAPGGNFFYTPNLISGNVSGFAFDILTGNATPLPGSPYPAGMGSIKMEIVNFP